MVATRAGRGPGLRPLPAAHRSPAPARQAGPPGRGTPELRSPAGSRDAGGRWRAGWASATAVSLTGSRRSRDGTAAVLGVRALPPQRPGLRGRGAAVGRSELTEACQGFRGILGAKVLICRPRDPEAKGLLDRAHDYLERSFLPGRRFHSPADFNAQLGPWLAVVNQRPRRAVGCAPTAHMAAERAAMLALPPVAPTIGWRSVRAERADRSALDGPEQHRRARPVGVPSARRPGRQLDRRAGLGAARRP